MAHSRIQDWVGLIAVLIAAAAAVAAIYQTRLMARQQAISVWPYAQMWAGIAIGENRTGVDEAPFSFNIANKGVGPAIIETVSVRRNGKDIRGIPALLYMLADENDVSRSDLHGKIAEASLDPGEVVQAGEVRWIVRAYEDRIARLAAIEVYQKQTVEVELCYCSLYEDCWRLTFPQAKPVKVGRCTANMNAQ